MKNTILKVYLVILTLSLMPNVLAALSISSSSSFSALHNSVLQIPLTVNSTTDITNITMSTTNIANASEMLPVTITNSSKLSIAANQVKDYTLSYTLPQYRYAGTYPITINVSGNENSTGNLLSTTRTISITVNESKGLSASPTSISTTTSAGATSVTSFSLINTGNVNLTNIAITQQSTLNDSDNNVIPLTTTSNLNLASLKPGQGATIYINATVPKAQQRRAYSTNLIVNSTEGIGVIVPYQIGVRVSYCDSGIIGGDFTVTIREPDENDDFYPNDNIPLTIRIKNNNDDDRDIIVQADLYDDTDDKFVDAEVETDATIEGDSTSDFEFTLKVPLDASNTHDYKIYAKAYEDGNEDGQCNEDVISIDIKKESHSIVIDKIEMPLNVMCNANIDAKVKLANAGKNDEDVKIEVLNSELGIDEERMISLDTEETRTTTISIKIPKNATEKDYTMTVRAYFYYSNDEYKKDITETKQIKVQGGCQASETNAVINAEILSQPYINEQFGIKVTVFNTGTSTTTYNIITSDYEGWARLDKIEPSASMTIEAGKSASTYLYLTPLQNISGTHTIMLKALYGNKGVEKLASVEVKEKTTATGMWQRVTQRLSNLSGFDLATVNIILGIAIILTFIWLLRVRRAY